MKKLLKNLIGLLFVDTDMMTVEERLKRLERLLDTMCLNLAVTSLAVLFLLMKTILKQ